MAAVSPKIVLVQGAPGLAGRHITKSLHEKCKKEEWKLRAAYASEQEPKLEEIRSIGCEVVHCDLNIAKTVDNALAGVHTVIIIPPYSEHIVDLTYRFIDKALNHNIKNIVLISVLGAESASTPYHKHNQMIEHKLKGTGINYSILRCGAFMEGLRLQSQQIKEGSLPLPLGTAKYAPVCIQDIADTICNILSNPELGKDKSFEITGPELLSGQDVAKIFSDKLGKQVNYVSVEEDAWKDMLRKNGVKPDYKIQTLSELYGWYRAGNGNRVYNDYENFMGKKGSTFTEFIGYYMNEFQ